MTTHHTLHTADDLAAFYTALQGANQAEIAAYTQRLFELDTPNDLERLKLEALIMWHQAASGDDDLDDDADEPPAPADAPPFPLNSLPVWARQHVADVAANLQTPIDLPAQIALGVLSSVCNRNRCKLAVTNTWTEGPNLYIAIAMPPGAGKSPAVNTITRPLEEVAELVLTASAGRRSARAAVRISLEAAVKKYAKQLESTEDPGPLLQQDYSDAAQALEEHDKDPDAGRMLADDTTPEALVGLLHRNGGTITLISTEGGMFDNLGRYTERGKAPNLDGLLKFWSGDTHRVDRVSGGEIEIKDPRATVCLTVQPSVVRKILADDEFQGRGLVARFMISMPPSLVGTRNMLAAGDVDPDAAQAWRKGVLATYEAGRVDLGMSPDASLAYGAYRQSLESRRFIGGDLEAPWLTEMSTKCESSVARVALILAVAEGAARVELDHVNRAMLLGHYWLGQAIAIAGDAAKDPMSVACDRVVAWAVKKGKRVVAVRDIKRAGVLQRMRWDDAEDIADVFDELESRGLGAVDNTGRSLKLTVFAVAEDCPTLPDMPDTQPGELIELPRKGPTSPPSVGQSGTSLIPKTDISLSLSTSITPEVPDMPDKHTFDPDDEWNRVWGDDEL